MSDERPRPLSFAAATARVFELAVGPLMWSRRTIFMVALTIVPVAFAVVWRLLDVSGMAMRINGMPVPGYTVFALTIPFCFLGFIVPALGVFYGTSLIADEVDDRTITYLFTRPIDRGSVALGKYLAYLVATTLVVLPGLTLTFYLLTIGAPGGIGPHFPAFAADLGALLLALAAYGAIFAYVGAQLRHPVLVGLLFAFGWEPLVAYIPGYLKKLTVSHYVTALVPHAGAQNPLQAIFKDTPPVGAALLALLAISLVFLALAVTVVRRREYVLEQ